MSILKKIKHHGLIESSRIGLALLKHKSGYQKWQLRNASVYANPTPAELATIERDLHTLGVDINDYAPSPDAFKHFQSEEWFPLNYHGGQHGGSWDEKLLEHWISCEMLGLMKYDKEDIFVDVAAASSPWVKALHERKGLNAFAIDLEEVDPAYHNLPYYRIENATETSFQNASVTGAALHCAYEMFMGEDDTHFIKEAARILKPGGKVIILPLYMHTHYCAYATPEHYGKGYSDTAAKEYVRLGFSGVPSSRKYDAVHLKLRILDPIIAAGMRYQLLVLRNKSMFGENIYCHFILEIEK